MASLGTLSSDWSEAVPRLGVCDHHPPVCAARDLHPSGGALQTHLLRDEEVDTTPWIQPPQQRGLWDWSPGAEEPDGLATVWLTSQIRKGRSWVPMAAPTGRPACVFIGWGFTTTWVFIYENLIKSTMTQELIFIHSEINVENTCFGLFNSSPIFRYLNNIWQMTTRIILGKVPQQVNQSPDRQSAIDLEYSSWMVSAIHLYWSGVYCFTGCLWLIHHL